MGDAAEWGGGASGCGGGQRRQRCQGPNCNLLGLGALEAFSGLTQTPLTHVCSAHILTDELGLGTELLGEKGFQASAKKGREGAAGRSDV